MSPGGARQEIALTVREWPRAELRRIDFGHGAVANIFENLRNAPHHLPARLGTPPAPATRPRPACGAAAAPLP